jgi:glycosyltransferase involved in cell wall biosynthesis
MSQPLVSIIMPVYNAPSVFEQTRASIRGQSLTDFEVITVDDGSTDGDGQGSTLTRLNDWCSSDARVKVLSQSNQGAGVARNLGLEHARGRYLWIIDADDFFEDDCLAKMVQAAEVNDADYVLVKSDRYRDSVKRFTLPSSGFSDGWFPPYASFNWREISGNVFESQLGWSWDKLFRRECIERHQLRFQPLRSSNDLSFVYSALVYSETMVTIDEPLAHYRVEVESSLSKTRDSYPENFYLALMDLKNNLISTGLFPELRQQFLDYAIHFMLWQLKTLSPQAREFCLEKLRTEWNRDLEIEQTPPGNFVEEAQYWEFMELLK